MKSDESEMEDSLRTEYNLRSLRVRRLGSGRNSFSGITVRLEPDVAEMFPSADAINNNFCMLKLYHTPISFNSRRVWVALLEKGLEFELVPLKLDGDQFQPEFLEINPFHHIPVLVDEGFNVVDSLAILDYLEVKYPTPPLLPTEARSLGVVRMVEMVTVNELVPAMIPLIFQTIGATPEDTQKLERLRQQLDTVLAFFERLIDNHQYLSGEHLTLADIVAGTVVPILPSLGVSLSDHPKISAWTERLKQRPAWVETQPSPKAVAEFRSRMASRMANRTSR